jgi:hypothetical protein
MGKTLLVGAGVFVAVLIVFAPAGLVRYFASSGEVTLIEPRGTLWNGQSRILIHRQPFGTIAWELKPVTVLRGVLRYDLEVIGNGHQLSGEVDLSSDNLALLLSGTVTAATVNQWLEPYNIRLSGTFTLEGVRLVVVDGVPDTVDGAIRWTGGPVDYTLAGNYSTGNLPEMTGYLGPAVTAVVYQTGKQTPLLDMALQPNGYGRIGVTKLLTKLLGKPWPGNDPDYAVVLEVEEQVF